MIWDRKRLSANETKYKIPRYKYDRESTQQKKTIANSRKDCYRKKRVRTTDQRVLKSICWIITSHQIFRTVQSPTFWICSYLYILSNDVFNAEVLARRLIGACIRHFLIVASHILCLSTDFIVTLGFIYVFSAFFPTILPLPPKRQPVCV